MGFGNVLQTLAIAVVVAAVGLQIALRQEEGVHPSQISNDFSAEGTMRAVVYDHHGEAQDVVHVKEVPLPNVRSHDVLIVVASAALNPVDVKMIAGNFKFIEGWLMDAPPTVSGFDVSGRVAAVGSAVTKFKIGDAVMAMANFRRRSTLAEYVAVEEHLVSIKPENIIFEEAASLPLAGLTSYQALTQYSHTKPGDRVLVLGGSGGCGTLGVQIAKSLGATVIATCSPASFDLVSKLGADQLINYRSDNFGDILSVSEDSKVDVVYDTIGGYEHWEEAVRVLKPGGTFVTIIGDGEAPMSLFKLARSAWWWLSRSWPFTSVKYRLFTTVTNSEDLDALNAMVSAGQVKAVTDSTYTLEEASSAFARMASGRSKGKVVIIVDPDV